MSNLPLLVACFLIGCVAIAAIGVLLYAAVLEGRYKRQQKAERERDMNQSK